jgi:hypothetical protein
MNRFVRCLATLGLFVIASLIAHAPSSARAVPVNFQGTAQDLSLALTVSGNAKVTGALPRSLMLIGLDYAIGNVTLEPDGFTYKVANNPANVPVTQKGTVTKATDPHSVGVPPVGNVYPAPNTNLGFTGAELTSATGLHLDLLNGAMLSYALNEFLVPRTQLFWNDFYDGTPANGPLYFPGTQTSQKLNFSATVNALYIEQDATKLPTFLSDGPGTGTFAIPSVLHATQDFTHRIGGFEMPSFQSEQATSFMLTGRYTVSGPPGNSTLELVGLQSVSLPLFYRSLTTDAGAVYSITSTFDLSGAALNFALNYRLQVAIPEPGSVLLLAIGLVSLAPLALRRLRQRYKPLASRS